MSLSGYNNNDKNLKPEISLQMVKVTFSESYLGTENQIVNHTVHNKYMQI